MLPNILTVEQFDYSYIRKATIQKRRKGNQGKRNNKRKYKNIIAAFDIETTNDMECMQAYMYIWQMQIDDITIIGRTWEEFLQLIRGICSQLDPDVYLIIFVHNLSFEFSFLKGIYHFQPEEVFATEPRKVLKCEMFGHIEFRCSYFLTNMSLGEFTRKMGVQDQKLSGEEFDYKKRRYPWTELSDQELLYCVNDVRGLVQALRIQIELDHDIFYTLPLTSTGYVRRDVKEAMRHYNRQDLKNMLPDYNVFRILREAFRGGNTHGSRYYSEYIIDDVKSYDIVSSYPAQQLMRLYPMSPWIREDDVTLDRVIRKIYNQLRACLMRVKIWNIRLKKPLWGCPYLPKAKSRNIIGGWYDNGRVLSADYLETSLTDLDFKILLEEYEFDSIEFTDFYHCRYGKLPKQLRITVYSYFEQKTQLKGVEGQELYYMKAKNKLNSIYGMSVQSPVKNSIEYIEDDFKYKDEDEEELLIKSNAKAFQSFAWGCWVTAWARTQLEEALKLVGDDFVYCDTDSVKYVGNHDKEFKQLNRKLMRRAKENGAFATDPKGETHYLGVFEEDAHYLQFIHKGAKKYAYINEDGTLGITVAGVAKSKGAKELLEAGGLSEFKDGFIFRKAGGTESVYNDDPVVKEIEREGHKLKITSNVLIRDSTYTLGVANDYRRLLDNVKFWQSLKKF